MQRPENSQPELDPELAAALRAGESRFRALIEKSWDHNFIIGTDGNVTYSSPAIMHTLGYSVEEFVGRNAFEFVHPDDLPLVLSLFGEILMEPGASRSAEHRGRHKDGSWRWLEGVGTNLLAEPSVKGIVCNYRDITFRKAAEEALRDSEHRFRQLADAMPQIAWTAGPEGRLDYYNRRWYEFSGAPEGEAGDESWKRFLHPDDVERCVGRWYDSVATGEPYEAEYRFRDERRGGYRWHLGRALAVRDQSGAISRWFGTSTDIDDQKRAQTALRDADRRKDEFLAMLSHELRNPLAAISNALSLFELPSVDAAMVNQARAIMARQCKNMARLIDDLLDVARVTQGKIALRQQWVNFDEVVARAIDTVRPLIEARRHELVVQRASTSLYVLGDPTRLEQIVTNLLNNAAKYTEPGGKIEVSTAAENGEAVLTVRDNGLGMSAEMLARAFDLFAQADRSLDRSQGGLGIGLTMVKSIVELHGGSVTAESAGVGRGSTLSVRLPASTRIQRTEPLPPAASSPRGATTAHRVLIVEDNRDTADTLTKLLEHWGYKVRAVYDGPSALEVGQDFHPQAILLDIGLPGIDGYEVARRVRSRSSEEQPLIVAITGYGREEDKRQAQAAGCDWHLTKPLQTEELRTLLGSQLAGR